MRELKRKFTGLTMSELKSQFTGLFSIPYGVGYNHACEFVPQFTGVERDAFIYQEKWEAFQAGYTIANAAFFSDIKGVQSESNRI